MSNRKTEAKFIIFGRWCSCNFYAVTYTFPICSPVLTCANSCKNTLSAKEIIEAQWYSRILNLYTCIPYCLFLTLYTLTSIYMHILHTFLCVLTRRICSTIKSFFLLVIICSVLMTVMFNLEMILHGEISSSSLFGVWGLEKVDVQIIENLVCLAFLFTLQ